MIVLYILVLTRGLPETLSLSDAMLHRTWDICDRLPAIHPPPRKNKSRYEEVQEETLLLYVSSSAASEPVRFTRDDRNISSGSISVY